MILQNIDIDQLKKVVSSCIGSDKVKGCTIIDESVFIEIDSDVTIYDIANISAFLKSAMNVGADIHKVEYEKTTLKIDTSQLQKTLN